MDRAYAEFTAGNDLTHAETHCPAPKRGIAKPCKRGQRDLKSQPFALASDALPLGSTPLLSYYTSILVRTTARTRSRSNLLLCINFKIVCQLCYTSFSYAFVLCVFLLSLYLVSFLHLSHLSRHLSHRLHSSLVISLISLTSLSISSLSLSVALALTPCSFQAALSLLVRGGFVFVSSLRSDIRALLLCFVLFTLGLWQTGIGESLTAGFANAVARVSVNEGSCVHAAPPQCKRSLQIAHTLCTC